MKPLLLAPMLIILASHQAGAQSPRTNPSVAISASSARWNHRARRTGPGRRYPAGRSDRQLRRPALLQIVAGTPAGKEVALTVVRRGERGTTTVTLGDQAGHFDRAAVEQLGPAYRDYLMLQVVRNGCGSSIAQRPGSERS